MKHPVISIIIPIYNRSKSLVKCIDSIIAQSYANIEIILVDDGSTDESPQICDSYAANDKRITVIHKKNAGVVSSRKVGVSVCSGDYIQFVDSDDWISKDMCKKMIRKAEETQSDIVWCRYCFVRSNCIESPAFNYSDDPNRLLHNVFLGKFPWNIFNIIYKRDIGIELFVKNFVSDNYAEDLLTTATCLLKNPTMSYVPETLYYYNRIVDNSLVLVLNTLGKGLYAGRNNVARLYEMLLQKELFEEYRYDFSRLIFNLKIYLLVENRIYEARDIYPFVHKDKRVYDTFNKSVRWIYWGAFNWGGCGLLIFRTYSIYRSIRSYYKSH